MKRILILASVTMLIMTACNTVIPEAPSPYGATPSSRQLDWHKLEYYAFIHFNMNTFTDMEWGMGDENPETFNPTELDAEQWVKVIKEAGMKGVILTAKHHDGFCLWPSKYTEHSVKNSPWRNGKGDVVKELSDACRKHNIKFGVYLSPWDRNHADYGREKYVTYFHNQLKELLTNYGEIFEVWFDGANGGTGYYGGANEQRSIDADTYYEWDKVMTIIRKLQPNAVVFGGHKGVDVRWVGNEEGVGGIVSWCPINLNEIPKGMTDREYLSRGDANGKNWIPAEVDVSVRPGWYYHHREDHQVKSLQHLVDIYYASVGRNASLLLNFPVDTRGLIHEKDIEQVMKLKATLDKDFEKELAHKSKASASSFRQKALLFNPHSAIDKSNKTYWAPEENDSLPTLTITFDKPTSINRIVLQEYITLGQRVEDFEIQAFTESEKWKTIASGQTIGYKTILRTETTQTSALRLIIKKRLAIPLIANFEVYNAPSLLITPTLSRTKEGLVTLTAAEKDIQIFYTLDGKTPTKNDLAFEQPFLINSPTEIQAVSYDALTDKYSEVYKERIDIPKKNWRVTSISSGDINKARVVIDNNPITEFNTAQTGKKQFITIDLGAEYLLKGFTYLPPQSRWAYGTISQYEFSVSSNGKQWKMVSKGEFSNIKNNPIWQEKLFDTISARYIKLVALDQVDDSKSAGFGEIGVITEIH